VAGLPSTSKIDREQGSVGGTFAFCPTLWVGLWHRDVFLEDGIRGGVHPSAAGGKAWPVGLMALAETGPPWRMEQRDQRTS